MSASKLKVKWSGSIVIGGPAELEKLARQQLEEVLYDAFSKCYYLDDSMRAAKYAEEITNKVPYQVKGKELVFFINLDVTYKNPPGPWKWWARIRTDSNTGNISNDVILGAIK